jgi:hypothetical protein
MDRRKAHSWYSLFIEKEIWSHWLTEKGIVIRVEKTLAQSRNLEKVGFNRVAVKSRQVVRVPSIDFAVFDNFYLVQILFGTRA